MTAYTEARDRLLSGYYNSGLQTVGNPGGLNGDGHVENFPKALIDMGVVAAEATSALAALLNAPENAAAALAAAEDAQGFASAALAAAAQFLPLSVAEIRAFTNNTKFLSALGLLNSAASVLAPFAATMTLDQNDGFNRHIAPLTANMNFNVPANTRPGHSGRWRFQQDGVGGRTVSFAPTILFPLGSEDIALGANAVSTVTWFAHTATEIEAAVLRGLA